MIKGVADLQENREDEIQSLASGDDAPQIMVPVSADDHARSRNRIRNRNLIAAVVLVLAAAWIYKHYTDPIHAQEALDAGERQLRSGQYSQAILLFDQAISYRQDYAEAFQDRGRATVALFRPKEALSDFAHYIELRPQDPVGYIDLGRAQLLLEDYPAALKAGTDAVRTGPEVGAAYQLRGIALRNTGKLEEALEDFNKAVALAPEMANYYERGSTYQDLGRHALAIEDFTEVLKFDDLNAQAYHARSKSYRELGDLKQAELDHRQGRRMDGR